MNQLTLQRPRKTIVAMAVALSLQGSNRAMADMGQPDLTSASLEELMNIQVTSVSKKPEALSQAGASVFVITAEDIRHSGAANIPDLLRMVPGVDVARIDANTWAISIRGFNSRYAQKLLVMIDGRTVYSPGFSGVYWDQQGVPLEDIDRIEVIRGPGGTIWGANAVNGVINIITRTAADTQGGLLTAGTGSEESAESLVQYGGKAGSKGQYRVFGRYFKVESSPLVTGENGFDGWHGTQGGFRSDWDLSPRDTLTVQGNLFGTSEGQTITTLFRNNLPELYTLNDKIAVATGNVMGVWKHTFSNGSDATVQAYYDRFRRWDQALDILHTGDLDFQYHFHAGAHHEIVTGTTYRITDHSYTQGYEMVFGSGHRVDTLVSTFFQDQILLTRKLSLTLGSKFEHNDYTGFEYEPSAQLVWTPARHQTVWASASRAIRQPSWLDISSDLVAASVPLPDGSVGLVKIFGNPQVQAEELRDLEIGYRSQLLKNLSFDITGFNSYYRNLETYAPAAPFFQPLPLPGYLVLPSYYGNLGRAHDYGIDFSASWDPAPWWRLSPGFSMLHMDTAVAGSSGAQLVSSPGNSPKYQAQIRSQFNFPKGWEWDTSAYYVSALGSGIVNTAPVPSYTRLDTRVGWSATEHVQFSVAGQNLLTPRHIEFLDGYQVVPTYVERNVVGRITWRF